MQHIAYWTDDFDADLERAEAAGFTVCMGGEVGENGRFVLLRGSRAGGQRLPGTVIELSEVAGPEGQAVRHDPRGRGDWDGKDPVRPFPDLSKL